ncbi:MAG: RND family transporter [Calditrichaeota bacterium]|nr:RND family transporter [Calditrichota bacterium]
MRKVFSWVVDHPVWTLLLVFALTGFFGYSMKYLKVETDISASLPKNIPAKRLYDKVSEIFPSKDIILVMAEADTFFRPDVIEQVMALTDSLEKVQGVFSVMGPTNVKIILGTPEGMEVREALDEVPRTPEEMRAYHDRLFSSDLFVGNIISEDGHAGGIMVFLKKDARPSKVAERVLKVLEASKGPARLLAAGKPVVNYYLEVGMNRDWSRLMPVVLLVVFFLPYLRFRSLRLVLIPLGVVVLSVVWTIGTMALVGSPLSHSTTVLPILLMSIGVADGIHILNRYLANSLKIPEKRELILATMNELRAPVVMTSLTTMAGFLALNTSRVGSLLQLGVFTAYGVFIALVLSLTFIPASLALMPIPKALIRRGEGRLEKIFVAYGRFLVRFRKAVLVGIILIVLVSLLGIPKIVLESNDIENFPPGHPIRQANEEINKRFAGSTTLDVVFEGQKPGVIKEPRVMAAMADLEDSLKTIPGVGGTLSLADYIRRINKVLHNENPAYFRIPAETEVETTYVEQEVNGRLVRRKETFTVSGRDLIAQYLQLYEMSAGPEDFANLVDYNYQHAKVTAFLKSNRRTQLKRIDSAVRAYLKRHPTPVPADLTGTSELYLAVNDLVVSGQLKSIIVSLLLVFLLTAFMFRSFAAGVFNALPLFFGIFLNFAFMGWSGIYLNLMTMVTSSIAIGVGVDYAIHFYHRYQMKIAEGATYEDATVRTMDEAGTAIFLNAATVATGFAVLLLSEFRGIGQMGLLIAMTMVWTSLGALTILPTLFMTLKPKFQAEKTRL